MNANTQTSIPEADIVTVVRAHQQVSHDLKNAILIVSVITNLVVVTTWLILVATERYDVALASLLLGR